MSRTLIFYVSANRTGKHDGDEFALWAKRYSSIHGPADLHDVDTSVKGAARAAAVEAILAKAYADGKRYDRVAFFMHGWTTKTGATGLQTGHKNADGAKALAVALAPLCEDVAVTVMLYCCQLGANSKTYSGEPGVISSGSFASVLAEQLTDLGVGATVYGHTSAGHTTTNPYVVHFGAYEPLWVVEPSSTYWTAWRKALKDTDSELWAYFPEMGDVELESLLAGTDPAAGGGSDADKDTDPVVTVPEDPEEGSPVVEDPPVDLTDPDPNAETEGAIVEAPVDEETGEEEQGTDGGSSLAPFRGCGCCCADRRHRGACPLEERR